MKASTFIKVALIDQMQQIADLGLWFHLDTLLAKGINTLAEINHKPMIMSKINTEEPDWRPAAKARLFPGYDKLPSVSALWASLAAGADGEHIWLYHEPQHADRHRTYADDGGYQIHVPTFFEDFKRAAHDVLSRIERGDIADIEMVRNEDEK